MRALLRAAGTDVAAQCFLNALVRETKDWRYLPATDADALSEIHIPLSQTASGAGTLFLTHPASSVPFPGNADSEQQRQG